MPVLWSTQVLKVMDKAMKHMAIDGDKVAISSKKALIWQLQYEILEIGVF
jgi:hypothetical protein